MLSHRRFSRPVLSTTQPSLRVKKQFSRQTRVLYYHAEGTLSTKRPARNLKKTKNRACKPAKTVVFLVGCLRKLHIRVWRSLVSRLNGVQEASSSNLDTRTILTKRYRCVWRKARRINRFRAFSSSDFFFQTIDANRCFRVSASIRTGHFLPSGRYIQPAPFLSGDFSG